MSTPVLRAYWRKQIRRISWLLGVWAVVAFGMSIFGAEALNGFTFGGIPFGFWMAQQGSIFVFVALILLNALLADRADREAGVGETAGTTSGAGEGH